MDNKQEKEKLIKWFNQMREIEQTARDTYFSIASDPRVSDEEVKKVFREIASDEERHSQIVQKIVNIITNNL